MTYSYYFVQLGVLDLFPLGLFERFSHKRHKVAMVSSRLKDLLPAWRWTAWNRCELSWILNYVSMCCVVIHGFLALEDSKERLCYVYEVCVQPSPISFISLWFLLIHVDIFHVTYSWISFLARICWGPFCSNGLPTLAACL